MVVAGPPCSGKSSLARALASELLVHVQIDAVFDLLLPGSDRNPDDRLLAYEAGARLARVLLDHGRTPMVECTYAWRRQRATLANVVDEATTSFRVVEVVTAPEEAVRRYRLSPGHRATDLTERKVRERAESYPSYSGALRLESATGTPTELALEAARWLRDAPVPIEVQEWVAAGRA